MGSSSIVRTDQATLDTVVSAAAMLSRVKEDLPAITDVTQVLGLRAAASAMQVFLKQRDAALGAQNDAAEIKIRTERRIGELTREIKPLPREVTGGMARGQGAPDVGTPSRAEALKELGIKHQRASEWERLADVPPEAFESHVASMRAKADLGSRTKPDALQSDEWYTPAKYIESARVVLGSIDLDPASNPIANKVVRAKRFFAQADDGLSKPWPGTVWINPPYVDGETSSIGTWIAYMIAEYKAGRLTAGILLVNASTPAGWFQQLWDYPLCFTDHRIHFVAGDGTTPRAPMAGNVFAYLGPDVAGFKKEFSQWGPVVRRVR